MAPKITNRSMPAAVRSYWLNKRRVAGEPAGIPACSSFAYSVINCFSIASSELFGNGHVQHERDHLAALVRQVVAQEVGIAEKEHEDGVLTRVELDETRAVAR